MADEIPRWKIKAVLIVLFLGGISLGWAFAVVTQSGCDCNQEMIHAYVDGLDACDRFWENTSQYLISYPIEPSIINVTYVNTTFWNESAKEWEAT